MSEPNLDDDERQLREQEARRGAALVARDATALAELFTDDMVHIHSTGEQMDKPQLLHYVLEVLQFLAVEREGLRVQRYGDLAVMTGRVRTRMQRVDRPDVVSSEALVTQVWRRTPRGWQQSHFHSCRAPGSAVAGSRPA